MERDLDFMLTSESTTMLPRNTEEGITGTESHPKCRSKLDKIYRQGMRVEPQLRVPAHPCKYGSGW